MIRTLTLAAFALVAVAAPAAAAGIKGHYVEARTCDVWTGPCFANADFNISGKHAVMAWRIDKGSLDGVSLDGLSVAAVVVARNTIGLEEKNSGRAVIIVDSRATARQREALLRFVKANGGQLVQDVVEVQSAPISLNVCECKDNACFELQAGAAKLTTRCINQDHDKACGNEIAFYPPIARGVHVRPAAAVEHSYRGTGLNQTWSDHERRGAYVGTFEVR